MFSAQAFDSAEGREAVCRLALPMLAVWTGLHAGHERPCLIMRNRVMPPPTAPPPVPPHFSSFFFLIMHAGRDACKSRFSYMCSVFGMADSVSPAGSTPLRDSTHCACPHSLHNLAVGVLTLVPPPHTPTPQTVQGAVSFHVSSFNGAVRLLLSPPFFSRLRVANASGPPPV